MMRSRSDSLVLVCLNSRLAVDVADRCHEVNETHLSLFDPCSKHITRAMQPLDMIGVSIPREVLERRIRITKGIIDHPIVTQGDAALLAGLVREIIRIRPSTLSPAAATIVRQQLLDLISVVLGNLADVTPKLGSSTQLATLKLRAAIDSQLTNPDADRASIAAAAGISERHANRVLAREGTSVGRLLSARRLARCAEAFRDPRQRHHGIADVAYSFGFRDLSHFTRVFKGCYGISPSEYRASALDMLNL